MRTVSVEHDLANPSVFMPSSRQRQPICLHTPVENTLEHASPSARQRITAGMHRLARYRSGRVELWITPCVVTMPPPTSTALIVPTNERLCGTQFAHFPKGGPTPAAPVIGERDYERPRAERLLYQCESVDGIVTEFGGAAYESAIAELPIVSGDADYPVRCKTGGAVRVPIATGPLAAFGDGLILAVPPFYSSLSWPVWKSTSASGAPDNSSLSHFSAMTRPS